MRIYKFWTHRHVGDHVIVTGAVRNIVTAHPDIRFAVPDLYGEVFAHNPDFIADPVTYTELPMRQQYGTLFQEQHALCGNLVEGHTQWLCRAIGIEAVPCPVRTPVLALSDAETEAAREWEGVLVLNANCQTCSITKGYPHWQEVVNMLKSRVDIVQIGGREGRDLSPDLTGVADMRGKTTLRRLFAMISGCRAVLGPPSCTTNIAAAFATPQVVVNAGREPDVLSDYPNAVHLSCAGPCGWGVSSGCVYLRAGCGNRMCRHTVDIGGRQWCQCQASIPPERVAAATLDLLNQGKI